MNKAFDRILEYLKKGDYSDAFPNGSAIPFEGIYDEVDGEFSENWIIYASISEFDPNNYSHHGWWCDEDDIPEYPDGIPTHVARVVIRTAYNGEGILYLVDGDVLKFIVTDDQVRMVNVDEWDGNQPAFYGGYIYDAKEWCEELAPIYYSNLEYHKDLEGPPYSYLTNILELVEPKNDNPDDYAWIKALSMKINSEGDSITINARVGYGYVKLESGVVVSDLETIRCKEIDININNDTMSIVKETSEPLYLAKNCYRRWCEELNSIIYQNFDDYDIGAKIK